jgi:hypothetical protein
VYCFPWVLIVIAFHRPFLASVFFLASAPPAAAAPPRVHPVVEGSCPSPSDLIAALQPILSISSGKDPEAWRLELRRAPGRSVRVVLRSPEGPVSLERMIGSEDCRALAEAISLILQTHFVKLRLLSWPSPPPPLGSPDRPRPPHAPSRSHPLHLSIGIGLGSVLCTHPELAAAGLRLDGGLRLSRWIVRLTFGIESPTVQETTTDLVRRFQAHLRVSAGLRLSRGRLWVAPLLEAGVALSRVTALSLDDEPSLTRAHLVVAAFLEGGVLLSRLLSLRLSAGWDFYGTADRYTIQPSGVVASSPRASFWVGLGLLLELPLTRRRNR